MISYYQAYQAYERKHLLGAFDNPSPKDPATKARFFGSLLCELGDLLIRAGLGLKRRYTAGRTMALSHMSGQKP